MQYRREIDGLRAIAVVPVILFHAGVNGFGGGYIGVDLFFVISGFLITSIILEQKSKNSFSLMIFYERRARRILPALTVVLLFTTLASYVLLPPGLLEEYSLSLVSVSTFSSNIYFFFSSGYFATAADEKPLLHTWSLAVEEQYYLIFPVAVGLFWYLGKKRLISIIAIFAALSFLASHFFLMRNYTDANFYLIVSRAWELLMGSLIAFFPFHKWNIKKSQKEIFSIFGLCLILFSIAGFDSETPFPSYYALIPTLGACLIIMYGNSTTWVGKLLSSNLLVSIGLISYSLYLWHYPLFAFLRIKSIGLPRPYLFFIAIILTFVISVLTWRYVEQPFRNRKNYSRSSIFKYSIASIIILLFMGMIGVYNRGFEQRFVTPSYADSVVHSPKRTECHTKGLDYLQPDHACKYFGDKVTWAVFGDSHTVELAYALAKSIEPMGEGLVHLSFSGCPPALLFESERPGCTEWTRESLDYLEKNNDVKNILLGYRHTYYLYGDQQDLFPEIPDSDPIRISKNARSNNPPDELREQYWRSFSEIISRLLRSGKNVYVLYPIPELPIHISKAVMQISVLDRRTMIDLEHATDADYYNNRNQFILSKLDDLHLTKRLYAIKPFDIICDGQYCPAVKDGKAYYFDDNHLSLFGAESLIATIAELNLVSKTH